MVNINTSIHNSNDEIVSVIRESFDKAIEAEVSVFRDGHVSEQIRQEHEAVCEEKRQAYEEEMLRMAVESNS